MTISQNRLGLIFLLVGPPGIGMNLMIHEAMQRDETLHPLPVVTTRPKRPNEKDGMGRIFVSSEQFKQMIEADELLEWQEVHQNLFYGILSSTVHDMIVSGRDIIAYLTIEEMMKIDEVYHNNLVSIYTQPPTLDELEQRLRLRGESEEAIGKRLDEVKRNRKYARKCKYQITIDHFEVAVQVLQGIIAEERRLNEKRMIEVEEFDAVAAAEEVIRNARPIFSAVIADVSGSHARHELYNEPVPTIYFEEMGIEQGSSTSDEDFPEQIIISPEQIEEEIRYLLGVLEPEQQLNILLELAQEAKSQTHQQQRIDEAVGEVVQEIRDKTTLQLDEPTKFEQIIDVFRNRICDLVGSDELVDIFIDHDDPKRSVSRRVSDLNRRLKIRNLYIEHVPAYRLDLLGKAKKKQ